MLPISNSTHDLHVDKNKLIDMKSVVTTITERKKNGSVLYFCSNRQKNLLSGMLNNITFKKRCEFYLCAENGKCSLSLFQ